MTSVSTRFFGQPSDTKYTVGFTGGRVCGSLGRESSCAQAGVLGQ